jgi:hypothetical protein
MTNTSIAERRALLAEARERVAARHAQPYHKNAIFSGDWDHGTLIRDEVDAINREWITGFTDEGEVA